MKSQLERHYTTRFVAAATFTAMVVGGILIGSSNGRASNDNKRRAGSKTENSDRLPGRTSHIETSSAKTADLVGPRQLHRECPIPNATVVHTRSPPDRVPHKPSPVRPSKPDRPPGQKGQSGNLPRRRTGFGPFPEPNSPLQHFHSQFDAGHQREARRAAIPSRISSRSCGTVRISTGRSIRPVPRPPKPPAASPIRSMGALLQIMPWPAYQDITDHDLAAIYAYLSAIPCIDTVVEGQPQLRNTCPAR